jgi:hypothetical protein
MKKLISLTILAGLTFFTLAQAPQGFSYQAVIRDSEGQPLAEQQVSIRLTLQDEAGETSHYAETHTVTTSPQGVVSLVVGSGTPVEKAFVDIPWNEDNVYIKVEVDPTGGSSYSELGTTKLQAVPYALHAQSANRFIAEPGAGGDEPLFVVSNSQEQIVFAVYEKGVRMYVEDDVVTGEKGNKSGFAIGGLTGFKQNDTEYFRVTPDSVRIYLREPAEKGNKGGFAIGGLTGFKADTVALMFVAPDSTRFYIDSEFTGKGNKSGFAIGGLTGFKSGAEVNYFNISTDTTATIDPSEARILWYPTKNAFMAGQVFIEDPDSVGTNSVATGYESKAVGGWSQAMGYKSIARGYYSSAIGKNAVANSDNSFAFGDAPVALGDDSYAFGAGAVAQAQGSFAFGSVGRDSIGDPTGNFTLSSGDYAFAIGQGSSATGKGAMTFGVNTMASGDYAFAAGEYTIANSYAMTAIGRYNYYDSFWSANEYITTDPIFVVGTGFINSRHNALTLLKNGKLGLLVNNPFYDIHFSYHPVNSRIIGITRPRQAIFGSGNGTSLEIQAGGCDNYMSASDLDGGELILKSGISKGDKSSKITFHTATSGSPGSSDNNPSEKMRITGEGFVGFGVTEPEFRIDLPNTASAYGRGRANQWSTYSDTRIKSNQKTIPYGLAEIMKLKPLAYFHHNSISEDEKLTILDTGSNSIGLLAQEVFKIIPEVVSKPKNEESELWSMSYDKLVTVLVKGMQEQQQIIEGQKNAIEKLTAEIEAIKAMMVK